MRMSSARAIVRRAGLSGSSGDSGSPDTWRVIEAIALPWRGAVVANVLAERVCSEVVIKHVL